MLQNMVICMLWCWDVSVYDTGSPGVEVDDFIQQTLSEDALPGCYFIDAKVIHLMALLYRQNKIKWSTGKMCVKDHLSIRTSFKGNRQLVVLTYRCHMYYKTLYWCVTYLDHVFFAAVHFTRWSLWSAVIILNSISVHIFSLSKSING